MRSPTTPKAVASLVFGLVMLVLAFPARADGIVVFDNGTPDGGDGDIYWSDFDSVSGESYYLEQAEDFYLEVDLPITGVHWWGAYASNTPPPPELDNFTIYFYEEVFDPANPNLWDGYAPAATPFHTINAGEVSRVETGYQLLVYDENYNPMYYDIYFYSLNIAPFTVDWSWVYYVSIVNDTPGLDNDNWNWVTSEAYDGRHWTRENGAGWYDYIPGSHYNESDLAFYLTGSSAGPGPVPEPATASLLGVGLLGLLARSRRRKGSV